MEITIWDGTRDLPYRAEPDEYITVSNCDRGTYKIHNSDIHITNRIDGRPDYYMLYLTNGKIIAEIDGVEKIAYPGDLVVYYPHTPQKMTRYRADKTINYWIHFNGYAIPEILMQSGFGKSGVYSVGEGKLIEETFMQLMIALKLGKGPIYVNTLFMQLMTQLAGGLENKDPDSSATRVLRGIMQMDWECVSPKKMPKYAAMCGMSVSRFSVVFRKATGKTPTEYITEARLKKACPMLEKTSLSISEVSESVGYRDPLYFSRVFKKEYGMSPSEYRKKHNR